MPVLTFRCAKILKYCRFRTYYHTDSSLQTTSQHQQQTHSSLLQNMVTILKSSQIKSRLIFNYYNSCHMHDKKASTSVLIVIALSFICNLPHLLHIHINSNRLAEQYHHMDWSIRRLSTTCLLKIEQAQCRPLTNNSCSQPSPSHYGTLT